MKRTEFEHDITPMVTWRREPVEIGKTDGRIPKPPIGGYFSYSVGGDSYAVTRARRFSNFDRIESDGPGLNLKPPIARDLRRRGNT